MKKTIGLLFCILLTLLYAFALADVAIDENNFPDEYFRASVVRFDKNDDGSLSDDEIAAVKKIKVADNGIVSLKGIEYFTNLVELHCGYNQLTELNVSKNTLLEYLYCGGNQLTKLDVSGNTALWRLECYDNQLTKVDFSKNTSLGSLICFNNQLTELDISKNTTLLDLSCGSNQLTRLDLSKNSALELLICENNQLTELDLSRNTSLQWLHCSGNRLTVLDVSRNTLLQQLGCHSNKLKKLDISGNPTLKSLLKTVEPVETDGHLFWSVSLTSLSVDKNVQIITGETEKTDIGKAKISTIKAQAYTGKAIKPAVTVKYGKTVLKEGTDYTVSYKNNKNVGKATVTITGKGNYTGKKTAPFIINPAKVSLSSLKAGSKQLTVSWKKGKGIDGYEIQYSLKKTMKSAKTVVVKKAATTKTSIKKLKAKKTYFVQIRAFKKVSGITYYSAWSEIKSAKVK